MSRETWHVVLTLSGLTFEIVGLSWVVVDVGRARREQFGERGMFRRVGDWFAYWLTPPTKHAESGELRVSAGATVTMDALVIKGDETEVERLQRELSALREQVNSLASSTDVRFNELNQRLEGLQAELTSRLADMETSRKDELRSSLLRETRGAKIFFFGAILSAIANLV